MRMCMEMIYDAHPSLSLIQIENILCDEQEARRPEYKPIIEDFFSYIFDMIWGFLEQEKVQVIFSDLFLHGSIFKNPTIFRAFGQIFEETCGYAVRKKRFNLLVPKEFRHDEVITY